jgi:hypothetical protein
MKINPSNPKIKAMVFAGCSFTWGQGLWYYSALDSLIEDIDYGYEPDIRNAVHHKFRKKWRWPKDVPLRLNNHVRRSIVGRKCLLKDGPQLARFLVVNFVGVNFVWSATAPRSTATRQGQCFKLRCIVLVVESC